jgi:hypothetical protein
MAKYKRYDYSQSMLIPVLFEEQLISGSLEFAIHTLVQTRMDMSIFDDNYHNDQTGRRAYDPKEKIEQKVKQLLQEQITADQDDDTDLPDASSLEKQIAKLQKQAERIETWLKENDAKIGANSRQRQSNVTDNESAKMMTSHGIVQGYNAEALVDKEHQVIMHVEAFGNGQDNQHLAPMVDGAKENMKKIGEAEDYFGDKIFTADTNYHNQGTLEKCQDEKLDTYIPDRKFRTRDRRFASQSRYQPKKGNKLKRFG